MYFATLMTLHCNLSMPVCLHPLSVAKKCTDIKRVFRFYQNLGILNKNLPFPCTEKKKIQMN